MRVLLLDEGNGRGALAAARAFARRGATVGLGTPLPEGLVAASRSCHRAHRVPTPGVDLDGFVDGVSAAARAGAYDLAFGCGDDWMAALATERHRLPVRVAHPPAEVTLRSLDKGETVALGEAAGLRVPRTAAATADRLASWSPPYVVKTRSHWLTGPGAHHGRIEATICESHAAARDAVAQVRRLGAEPILQELVSGQLLGMIGIFTEGRLHCRLQQEATGMWPLPAGMSAAATSVPLEAPLVAGVERLLADLGWSGLVQVEFMRPHDGSPPQLIDVNGRFYATMALAAGAGLDLPNAWARLVLEGRPPPDGDAASGVEYCWLEGDLRRALVERRGGLGRDVRRTLARARRSVHGVWSRDDPAPARRYLGQLVRRGTRKLVATVGRSSSTEGG